MVEFPLRLKYTIRQRVTQLFLNVSVDERNVIEVPFNDKQREFWSELQHFRQQERERIRDEHLNHVEGILEDIEL